MYDGDKGTIKERPTFGGKQVRKESEIEMGKLYRWHHGEGRHKSVTLIFPIRKSFRTGWIEAKVMHYEPVTEKDIEEAYTKDIPLTDCGVIPYKGDEGDVWNEWNWLERVEEK